uniref:Granulocyte colony-stimulating factor n=1 Tax=Salmo trutta TaxID=8032 RepID=A0A674DIF2_SALTR
MFGLYTRPTTLLSNQVVFPLPALSCFGWTTESLSSSISLSCCFFKSNCFPSDLGSGLLLLYSAQVTNRLSFDLIGLCPSLLDMVQVSCLTSCLIHLQEVCLSSMSAGLQLYQDVLGELKERMTTDKVTGLLADIRDLLAQVNKMQEPGQMSSVSQYEGSGLASRLPGDYEVQVATHFTLLQLRDFTQNLKRSLRNVEHLTSRPGQRG